MRNAYSLVAKHEGRRKLVYLGICGRIVSQKGAERIWVAMDWIRLVQCRVKRQAVVDTVMNLCAP
jgi:hypothetical protein